MLLTIINAPYINNSMVIAMIWHYTFYIYLMSSSATYQYVFH